VEWKLTGCFLFCRSVLECGFRVLDYRVGVLHLDDDYGESGQSE